MKRLVYPSPDLMSRLDRLMRLFADHEAILAASLSGSLARNEADSYSDIDLRLYSRDPIDDMEAERLLYQDGHLVSVSLHTFFGEARQFSDPPNAVFAVEPIRSLVPLLDRSGELAELQRQAHAFQWISIRDRADHYAARTVYLQAEVVHKIMGSLTASQPLRTVITVAELVQELTLAMTVAYGVLVVSDRSYLRQVYEAVGPDSAWVAVHKVVVGIDDAPQSQTSRDRGMAAIALYRETVTCIHDRLSAEQRAVVDHVRALADAYLRDTTAPFQ